MQTSSSLLLKLEHTSNVALKNFDISDDEIVLKLYMPFCHAHKLNQFGVKIRFLACDLTKSTDVFQESDIYKTVM